MARKILSVLLSVLTMFLGITGVVSAAGGDVEIDVGKLSTSTFKVSELAGKYKVQGRSTIINNVLMLDYSAAGIEFSALCEGDVKVTFNTSSVAWSADGGCYFTVIVDGVKMARDFCHITATGDTEFVIAKGLTAGTHTFEIYRQTEIERATIGIKNITVTGQVLPAPQNNDMYIEFIGDSITTAYGNLTLGSTNPSTPSAPIHQDATQGYAYLTAKSLGADWSIVARQGIGAVTGYQPVNMQTVYPLLRHHKDSNTKYDFPRQPDYVVIGLGANDFATYNNSQYTNPVMTVAQVKQGFSDMFDLVKSKNPDAKIIWVYGWTNSSANAGTTIKEVIAEKGGAEAGYYTLEVEKNTEGANNHSYYTAHAEYAKKLSAFIKSLEPITFTPGNVNGDAEGKVNLEDVVTLAQCVAQWSGINYVTEALDPDGSGVSDLSDVVRLAQYVAQWDVDLSQAPYQPQ